MTSKDDGDDNEAKYQFTSSYGESPPSQPVNVDTPDATEGERKNRSGLTLLIVLVAGLYILIVLQIADQIYPTSSSLLSFLLFFAIIGGGGAALIAFGMHRLLGGRRAIKPRREDTTGPTYPPPLPKPLPTESREQAEVAQESAKPTTSQRVPPPSSTALEESVRSDTLTSIYARQKSYAQRASELLKELQSTTDGVVQLPAGVLGSAYNAAYLTSDAVVVMFDKNRYMTSKPLRDFPSETIASVVAACTPRFRQSLLQKKVTEATKANSLLGAVKELEALQAEVEKELKDS